ncbi:MAG: DUF3047 domain-containing protein [Ideonella sp.]|nr:DUF3047 domain-containing protein [Ideonella sp.]
MTVKRSHLACLALLSGALLAPQARGAEATELAPFKESAPEAPAPWGFIGLPGQTKPKTRFSIVEIDGRKAVRVEAQESYGNIVHPLKFSGPKASLSWQWKVETPIPAADLRTRQGDDTAVKVCVFFDMPLDLVPFVERQLQKIAQSKTTDPLPNATVCYVWDNALPVGTELDNAFTRRMRYIVLESGPAKIGQWKSEKRNVMADFTKLFGAESPKVPPVMGIAIGADADNTKSRSVSYVANIQLDP